MSDPFLLIAGLGQGSWVWHDVLPELAQDRRVFAPDVPGTGELNEQAARRSIGDMALDMRALLHAERIDRAHVVGLSMGGYVAMTVALEEPELVRSLVLAGTGGGGPDRVRRPRHVADAFAAALGSQYEDFARETMPYTFAEGWTKVNPERFEEILAARLERPTPYATIEAHAIACYAFYDSGIDAERIRAPALVIHGDQDLIIPVQNGRKLAARLPNAEYVGLEMHGHNLPLEDPERFSRLVLEFVASVE
jgi:pimeloyl-ACP methyl ester carboxylesterase